MNTRKQTIRRQPTLSPSRVWAIDPSSSALFYIDAGSANKTESLAEMLAKFDGPLPDASRCVGATRAKGQVERLHRAVEKSVR